jgi:hypothetical protein
MFTDAVESYRIAGQPLSGIINARLFAYAVLPFCLSLLGVASSVGLFGLREWARKMAIFLSVAPVTICGLLPVSAWWLILCTRQSVRSQFRSEKTL